MYNYNDIPHTQKLTDDFLDIENLQRLKHVLDLKLALLKYKRIVNSTVEAETAAKFNAPMVYFVPIEKFEL